MGKDSGIGVANKVVGGATGNVSSTFYFFSAQNQETEDDRLKDETKICEYLDSKDEVPIIVALGGNTNWLMTGLYMVPNIARKIRHQVLQGKAGYVSFSAGTVAAGQF